MEDLLKEVDSVQITEGDFEEGANLEDTIKDSGDAPVVRLVNMVLLDAIKKKASKETILKLSLIYLF